MRTIERILALNLFTCTLVELDSKKAWKVFKYMLLQWTSMLLMFAIGYGLSILVQSSLTQHTPVNNIAITVSVSLFMLTIILSVLSPFFFGYHFNKYATDKLKLYYK